MDQYLSIKSETMDVTILIPSLRDGGAERVTADVFENLPNRLTRQLVTIYDEVRYPINRGGYICLNRERVKTGRNLKGVIKFIKQTASICRHYIHILKKSNTQVSFSILGYDQVINIFSCIITGKKHIISERNYPARPLSKTEKIINWFIYFIGGKTSSKIICNSEGVKHLLSKMYHINPDKITVIYNPKDVDKIHKEMLEPLDNDFFDTDEAIIITSGRLVEQKGHWHLIRIVASLQNILPCKLVICGIGPLESYLKDMVSKYNLDDKVFFTGWCDNPHKYVYNSDLFVFPSLHEAQPNALIEAIICGCPVIATDCEFGPREILGDNEFGVLTSKLDGVMRNDAEPLSQAEVDMRDKILSMLQNEELRLMYSERGMKRGNDFRKEIQIQKYYDTISDVLKK